MFDFLMLVAMLGIGAVGGYLIALSEGDTVIDKARNFLGLRPPPRG